MSNRELLKQFVDGTPLPPTGMEILLGANLIRRDGDTSRVTTAGSILLGTKPYLGYDTLTPPPGTWVEVTGDSASCPDDYAIAQEAQNQQARKGLDVGAMYYKNRERNEVDNGLKIGTLREVDPLGKLLDRAPSPLDTQIGGSHYKDMAIQPVEFIEKNGIRFLEGCIIKRAARHDKKTGAGAEDLRKIIHEASLLLELRYGEKP